MSFFSKKPVIEVFVRHCHYSEAGAHKNRFENFSREACFDNLMQTADSRVNFTFLLDTFYPSPKPHFLREKAGKFPLVEISAGTEALSFLHLLNYVRERRFSSETLLYFLEDDYIHRPDWADALREAFSELPCDYVTLFDHQDKYTAPEYQNLQSHIFQTKLCHWRTTPSTTNTYSMKYGTLLQDFETHLQFSQERKISADHEKFCALTQRGRVLLSSLPGFATHVEKEYASPCVDWKEVLTQSLVGSS